ncbi:hypothetical protein NL533_36070, partial [Klebsiella pneumoniae]|nr:hypothetical protein [Klebsiella pneumoniae]
DGLTSRMQPLANSICKFYPHAVTPHRDRWGYVRPECARLSRPHVVLGIVEAFAVARKGVGAESSEANDFRRVP